jgi:hypothetical protein
MTSPDRGMKKPYKDGKTGMTIKVDKLSGFIEGTKGIFVPASGYPEFISNTKPLLDRTNTPRGAMRSISLSRNFTNRRWLYNKHTLDDLNPEYSKIEIQRGRKLRRITQKENKARSQSPPKQIQSSNAVA